MFECQKCGCAALDVEICVYCERDALKQELAALKTTLLDGESVRVNILRGTITLTRDSALHIAGATDYDSLKSENERLRGDVEKAKAYSATLELWRDGMIKQCEAFGANTKPWEELTEEQQTIQYLRGQMFFYQEEHNYVLSRWLHPRQAAEIKEEAQRLRDALKRLESDNDTMFQNIHAIQGWSVENVRLYKLQFALKDLLAAKEAFDMAYAEANWKEQSALDAAFVKAKKALADVEGEGGCKQ